MERSVFYIVLIMLSHLTTIFAMSNESRINRSTNKVEKTNKKITFKNIKADNIPARKVSADSGSTADTEIYDESTEGTETTQNDDYAENIEEKSDAAENKRMSADNGLFKKDHEESLYHPIYSLENLDYYLRHPDKISPNFNPIRSEFLPNNIYNTNNPLQSKILEFIRNFFKPKPLTSFSTKFPYESIKGNNLTLKGPQGSIFTPESFKKVPMFTESKLPKVIQDFLKKPSLLSDPFSHEPSQFFRISSQDDISEWNLRHNHIQQFSNNVNSNKAPLVNRSHDKRFHRVFNIQQVSFLSSPGSRLPRELFDAINDFFNKVSVPYEPKILKSFSTLVERLLNIHPLENSSPLKIQHSIYSSLLQQQSVAPTSSPSPDENDYLSQAGDQTSFYHAPVYPDTPPRPDNLHDILPLFTHNISIFPKNSQNIKDDNDIPKDLASLDNTSSLVEQLTRVPLLELTTSPSKDIPQQSKNFQLKDHVSSMLETLAVFIKNSLDESIPTSGSVSLSGKNSQPEARKPIDLSSFLEKFLPSDQTKTFEFVSPIPAQSTSTGTGTSTLANNVSLDKSLLSSEDTLLSSNTVAELTQNTEKPLSYSIISQNTLLFNKTQSSGNLTFIDNTRSISPDYKFTSDNVLPFKSVPNSESSQNKTLDTTVYLDMPPSLSTGINELTQRSNISKNKIAQNVQNERNVEEHVTHVGDTKKEKNPDCLKGSTWISKCHECNCSDDGFPDCIIIQECVLPPHGKAMLCKPFTNFEMGECNYCTCSGDGVPICKFTDCYLYESDKVEELMQYTTPSENPKENEKTSKRNNGSNDILRSDDSDYDSEGRNNTSIGNRKSRLYFDDEDFDTGNEYGHRRVGKRLSQEAVGLQRCEVGSVWEINCFNCFCGLNGRPSCDKIAHCTLLPYGKSPRCKPTTAFDNRCGGVCKCDDEGEPWCDEC